MAIVKYHLGGTCNTYTASIDWLGTFNDQISYIQITRNTLGSVQPGTYQLVNVKSNRCLDVPGGSVADGAELIQWDCHNANNQKWRVEAVGVNYRLVAMHSGKAADVPGGSTQSGTKLIQWGWHGGTNQQWQIRPVNGSYELVNVNSGLCMDVTAGSTLNGAKIQQWNCNGTNAQRWQLQP